MKDGENYPQTPIDSANAAHTPAELSPGIPFEELTQTLQLILGTMLKQGHGPSEPSVDAHMIEMTRRLFDQEEPIDVLYALTPESGRILDKDYFPAAAAVIRTAVNGTGSTEELISVVDNSRRLLMFEESTSTIFAQRKQLPAMDILAGKHGDKAAAQFALGAISAVEHLVSVLANRLTEVN